jgi:DNA-binding transcriptional regulator YiaG
MAKTKKKTTTKRRRRTRPEWTLLTLEHLEQSRAQLGMSKTAWAKRLSVSVQAYHAWLAGTNVPTLSRQQVLVQKLDAGTGLALLAGQGQASMPTSCGGCPVHCGRAQLAPEVAETLRAYALALLDKVEPAEIPGLVSQLRESLS